MNAARPPRFCACAIDGQGEGGFPGRLGSENFDDAPAREAADAKGAVDEQVAGGDDIDVDAMLLAHLHDRPLAEILLNLLDRQFERLGPRGIAAGVVSGSNGNVSGIFFGHGRKA